MDTGRRILVVALSALSVILFLVVVGLFIFTATDWGREQTRQFALDQIRAAINGEIEVGRVEGHLLDEIRLIDVSIVDTAGRPFLSADTVSTQYSLRALFSKRIRLSDLKLVNADVVLDRPPGEDWNFVGIFRSDAEGDTTSSGWGRWVELRDITLVDSRLTMRTEWEPPPDLSPAEEREAIRQALAGEIRDRVLEVPGGFQNVMSFRELNAEFSRVLVSHPDTAAIPIEIDQFSGIAEPFNPPAAHVRDLSGNFRLQGDTLYFHNIDALLPDSRLQGDGFYAMEHADLQLGLEGSPVALDDLRWLNPAFPEEGGGTLDLELRLRPQYRRIIVRDMDLQVGESELQGRIDLQLGDTVRVQDTDLQFARLDTRLIERLAPELSMPRHGRLTGSVEMEGRPEDLQLDADVTFDDYAGGTSRVLAVGGVGAEDNVRFRRLQVRMQPLQLALVRAFVPDLPLSGTVEGTANLTGTLQDRMDLESDLILRDRESGVSRVTANGGLLFGETVRLDNLRMRLDPFQLDLLRSDVPDLPRGATASGPLRLHGPIDGPLDIDGDLTIDDPATGISRVAADGGIHFDETFRFDDMRLRFDPLSLDLLRWVAPDFPAGATASGPLRLHGSPSDRLDVDGDLTISDPASGVSRVVADGGIRFGETTRFDDMQMRLDPLRLDLVRSIAPDLPAGATASGPLRLDGAIDGLLDVDGDLTIDDPATGVSRVAARGGIDLQGELRFRDLDLAMDPLQLSLLQSVVPDLPIGGVFDGTATISGSPSSRLTFDADLVHVEAGDRSHVTGSGDITMDPTAHVDLDLRLNPLSLRTLGRFVPQARLRGSAEGDLQVLGTPDDFAFDADLYFGDAGSMNAVGRLRPSGAEPVYDFRMEVDNFIPAAVSARAPMTAPLVGTAEARGRGTDPATMQATIQADLQGVDVGDYEADEVHLQMEIDRGLATVAPSRIVSRSAEAEIEGTFGLVAGREGELDYRVRIDSLNMFAPWIPAADTGVVPPRPSVREAALAESERAARDAEVEFLATGELPELSSDTLAITGVPRDSLAGSLDATGTLRGNIEQFDADGHAVVRHLLYQGNYVERGEIDYALVDVRSEDVDVTVDGSFEHLLVGGYAFDAATIDGTYRGGRFGTGEVDVSLIRDEESDLQLASEFVLALERNELRLTDMEMRLDTTRWATTEPAAVYWGGDGVTVDNFDLQSDAGGRIFIDGELPIEGEADLDLVVQDLELELVSALLQHGRDASGTLSLDAKVRGTLQNPLVDGELTLLDAGFDGQTLPDIRGVFDYVDEELVADAQLVHDSLDIATVQARIPVNLAFGDGGPRLLERPMQIDVEADELSLDVLTAFTDQVEGVEGTIAGNVSITGTPGDPTLEGDVSLDMESLEFSPLGIRFEPLRGHASMSGNVLRIDSLVAYSDGPALITGEIRLESLTNPVFDLEVETRDTWVIDTNDARLQVDADLTIQGPLESIQIGGLVRTRRGVIYIPEMSEFGPADVVDLDDPATAARLDSLLTAQRNIVTERSPMFENVEADIQVEIDRDVWLRSTEANVEIYTPSDVGPLSIHMRGLQEMPSIEGTINTDRGEYEYLSRRFTLTRGAVSFLGGEELNPMLQLAAEHEVRIPGREALTIRIIVGGTLRDLEITLESNSQPPISQTDLLSFLAFGREASTLIQGHGTSISGQATGGGGLVGNVAGIATQQFTAIALESMLSGVEAEIGRDLGLDVVRITPAHMSADIFTGSYLDVLRGTEFEAGRYVNSRLFVAAQARPIRALPGLRFEYRTRRDFQWSASYRSRIEPREPTLRDLEANRLRVFGSFLFKEWRF